MSAGHSVRARVRECVCECVCGDAEEKAGRWGSGVLTEGKSHLRLSEARVCMCVHAYEKVCGHT